MHSYKDKYPARTEMENNGRVIPGRATLSMGRLMGSGVRERNGLSATGTPGRDDKDFSQIAQAREGKPGRQKK